MDEQNVNQDTPNTDDTQDVIQDINSVDVAKVLETNKRLYGRAKAAEAELKAYKNQLTPPPQSDIPSPQLDDKLWEVAEYIREGYSREDVDFIIKNGGKEALAQPDSYVSVALKAKQEQRRAEEAAAQTGKSGFGEIERQYTPEQLKNMSAKELEAILPKAS